MDAAGAALGNQMSGVLRMKNPAGAGCDGSVAGNWLRNDDPPEVSLAPIFGAEAFAIHDVEFYPPCDL